MVVELIACFKPLAAAPAVLQIPFTFLIGIIIIIGRAVVFSGAVVIVEFFTCFEPLTAVPAVLQIPFAFLIGIIMIIRTVIVNGQTLGAFPGLEFRL